MKFVCRCEDITEDEIIETIKKYDCHTLDELKQILRLGMGPCQGRTCLPIAARILARERKKSIEEIDPQTSRPPIIPVAIYMVSENEGEG